MAYKKKVLPLFARDGEITMAMADPCNLQLIDDLTAITGLRIEPVRCDAGKLEEAVERYYGPSVEKMFEHFEEEGEQAGSAGIEEVDNLEMLIREPSLINLVNLIIFRAKAIGRLYGQVKFTFDEHSNSLIVITNSESNFKVIEEMIEVLDKPVPKFSNTFVIELERGDAQEVAYNLNLLFATGGAGTVSRSRGAEERTRSRERNSSETSEGRVREEPRQVRDISAYWLKVKYTGTPISTLIGKVRIIPSERSNALIITCEPSHEKSVRELIASLDQADLQVLIDVVITEVTWKGTTNLGMRFSADLTEVISEVDADEVIRGVFGMVKNKDEEKNGLDKFVLTGQADITLIIQYLQREANVKVKLSPNVFTTDNQEAELFIGQEVPFPTGSSQRDDLILQTFDYKDVGTHLIVTPHIIVEKGSHSSTHTLVDMDVTLKIDSVVPGETVLGGFILNKRETNTRLVVNNGQTMVLSGIMRQEEVENVKKIPILGDIPILSLFFKKKKKKKRLKAQPN